MSDLMNDPIDPNAGPPAKVEDKPWTITEEKQPTEDDILVNLVFAVQELFDRQIALEGFVLSLTEAVTNNAEQPHTMAEELRSLLDSVMAEPDTTADDAVDGLDGT